MSAFLGVVRVGPGAVAVDPSILPDQPGLGPARFWNASSAALLHRQRVNTPEDRFEAQPTPAWGGTGAILFDGRLDDRAGLCEKLGIIDRPSRPDSELVARAFEKWDDVAASMLIGDFVIAAWDGRNRRAILCSDRGGLRPLYFHRSGDLVIFGTVLPALLSVPGVPCVLDETVVADVLFYSDRDSRRSYFRGIDRVLRGTVVTLSESGEKLADYWRPAAGPRLILRRDEDYVEAAREVLDRAVACRLRSIAPVPIRGSGGLDSCCIMASVLGQTNAPELPVFTSVPETGVPVVLRPGKYISEKELVLAMQAAFPRLVPRFIEPGERPDIEYAPERIFEEAAVPIVSVMSSGWAETTLQRMRAEGATSCLGGHMGNATLTWNGLFSVTSLFREGRWIRAAAEAAALAEYRPLRTVRTMLGTVKEMLMPPGFRTGPRHQISLHPRAEADLNMTERLRAAGDRRYRKTRDGVEQRVQMLTTNWGRVGESVGWGRARHGIEARDPTNDSRVIEFCLSIPEDQYLRGGQTRWLARRLLRAAGVPAEIADNTKRGEWCPEWFARLERRRPDFDSELARLRESPAAARLLNLELLENLVAHWPPTPDGAGPRRGELETMFTTALHLGSFIRWAEAKSAAHKYPSLAITSP